MNPSNNLVFFGTPKGPNWLYYLYKKEQMMQEKPMSEHDTQPLDKRTVPEQENFLTVDHRHMYANASEKLLSRPVYDEAVPFVPGLTETSLVHYTAYNGRCLAAMVIGHFGNLVDLVVFTNLENVNGKKNYGMQFHTDIAFSESGTHGTWHWVH